MRTVAIVALALEAAASCGGGVGPLESAPGDAGVDATGGDSAVDDSSSVVDAKLDQSASLDASADAPTDVAVDAADAASDVASDGALDAGAALFVCDAVFGSAARSFKSCCSSADQQTSAYQGIVGLAASAQTMCNQNLSRSLAAARIAIDDGQSQRCAAALAKSLAANPLCWEQVNENRAADVDARLVVPECTTPVTGLQQAAQPCQYDYECADGLTCVGWTNTSDGVCKLPPARGEACMWLAAAGGAAIPWYPFGTHPSCVAGSYCLETCAAQAGEDGGCAGADSCLPGLDCVDRRCTSNGFAMDGGNCGGDQDCVDGLFCAYDDAGGGTCAPKGVAGAPCFNPGPHGYAMCLGYCAADGGSPGTCAAVCSSR